MTGRTRFLPLARLHTELVAAPLALLTGGLLLAMPTLADISYVQGTGFSSNIPLAVLSRSFSSAQQAGNLIVVMVASKDMMSIQSVTDSKGNTYVLAVGQTVIDTSCAHAIYYAKNIAAANAGTNTVTVRWDDSAVRPDIRIAEYSGVDTISPFDGGVAATGTTGLTMDSGPLTVGNANDLLVAGNCAESGTTAAGPGYTARLTPASGRILEDRIVAAAGSYNATATQSTSGRWIMQLAAFKAAPGNGGDTQAPTAPTNLSAAAVSSSQINLSWTASTDNVGVTNYLVERCQNAGCFDFAEIATPVTTSYNDTGLWPSASYRYRVRARDAAPNYSAYSTATTATTQVADAQPPTIPVNLSATTVSSTQINLSWTASTDNVAVTNYLVERCQGAGCSNFAQIATPATTSYDDTGRSPSTSYSYRVRAQDSVPNFSAYSTTASATTPAASDTQPPTAPSGLTVTAGANQNLLGWTASTDNVGVTAYLIERCQGASCSSFAQIGTSAITMYTDNTALAGISYSYRVRARDAVPNFSSYSNIVTSTPADCD